MAGETFTTTSIGANAFTDAKVDRWFGKTLLKRGEQDVVAEMFAKKAQIPKGQGAPVASWLRYDKMRLAAGTLSEGVPPGNTKLGINLVSVTASDYGQVAAVSDKLIRETNHDVPPIMAQLLGEAMTKRREQVTYDALLSNTNTLFSGTSNTARSNLASGDVIDSEDVLRAIDQLIAGDNTRGRAPKFSGGAASGRYAALIHPKVWLDLRQDSTFSNALEEQDIADLRMNRTLASRVFDWEGVRFFVTNFMPEFQDVGTAASNNVTISDDTSGSGFSGGSTQYVTVIQKEKTRLFPERVMDEASVTNGSSFDIQVDLSSASTDYVYDIYTGSSSGSTNLARENVDPDDTATVTISSHDTSAASPQTQSSDGSTVYPTWFFGEEAYGAVDVQTSLLEAGFVPRGRSFNDPLAQLVKAGWKMSYAALILDDLKICRLESTSSF